MYTLENVTLSRTDMHPEQEHQLRRWIADVLAREGYSLKRTREFEPEFSVHGRWSRWYYDKFSHQTYLVEPNVDLENLARRCHAYLNGRVHRN